MKTFGFCFGLAMFALGVSVVACNDDPAPLTHDGGPTPAGQPRSYRNDIIPIMAQACAQPSCHGDTANPNVLVHFSATDPDALYTQMTAVSPTAKGVKLIVPGDPSNSYLFVKMTGDQDKFMAQCGAAGCGTIMPPGSKVSTADRQTLQTWIMEGAKKD